MQLHNLNLCLQHIASLQHMKVVIEELRIIVRMVLGAFKTSYMQYVGQRITKLPVLLEPYLLRVMYYNISVPESFMYTCYRMCT